VVGVIAAIALIAFAQILPLTIAILLSMALSIFVTGAFHEDGVSDYADGMGGGFTRERVLSIMKDSRIGSYGAITVAMVLLIKFQALNEIGLLTNNAMAAYAIASVLIVGHVVSRFAAIMVMQQLQYIRDDDDARAKPAAQTLSRSSALIAFMSTLATIIVFCKLSPTWFATGNVYHVLATFAAAVVASFVMWAYMVWRLRVRLGGYTGDCLGATQQLCEIAFYVGWLGALTALARLA
jgi:adenosylcobinamide-GDP ribazoletransferase